jgi:hypothetical protein
MTTYYFDPDEELRDQIDDLDFQLDDLEERMLAAQERLEFEDRRAGFVAELDGLKVAVRRLRILLEAQTN